MWQRKQTLFLLITILINFSLFFLELATISSGDASKAFSMYGVEALQEGSAPYATLFLAIILSISMTLSFMSIVLFKKRHVQIKLSQFNLLVQMGFIIALFYMSEAAMEAVQIEGLELTINYELGTYLTVLPLLFIFLAIRFIKKDEALVRAADRIR